jgi:hypothetical protein
LQTEEEWRVWEFIYPILSLFKPEQVGERKPLLFTAACMRRQWHWPDVEKYRWAIEALEQQADNPIAGEEALAVAAALRKVRESSTDVMGGMYWQMSIDYREEPETDPWEIAWGTAGAMLIAAARRLRVSAGLPDHRPEPEEWALEERSQCDLLRCIFGNPFRQSAPERTWRNATVVALAAATYEERILPDGRLDPFRLVVLADALEEAGCTDREFLGHLREPGPHVRGCWAVDTLLDKT